MKRFPLPLAFTFLLVAMSAHGQEKPGDSYTVSYDRFKDVTIVTLKSVQLSGTLTRGLSMRVGCTHEGKAPAPATDCSIAVFSAASELQYRNEPEMIFLVNDERVRVGKMISARREYESGMFLETLFVPASLSLIKKISTAMSVEGQVGSVEFKLTLAQQSTLKEFVKYFEPAAK